MLTELEQRADNEARHAHRELVEELTSRCAALEAKLSKSEALLVELQPNDGRPCPTDQFLAEVIDYDEWQLRRALEAWVEGAWDEAIEGTTLAELKGKRDE